MPDYLASLTEAVRNIIGQTDTLKAIERLKHEVHQSDEPFVWAALDLEEVAAHLPGTIRSGWIFVLKRDRWTGEHMHPNSVQHMIVVEGKGTSRIGKVHANLQRFNPTNDAADQWQVIEKNVPHEFFPVDADMVVLSFHTCPAEELIEVSTVSGHARRYIPRGTTAPK